ncbi:MAG: hypothetical protein LBL47_01960 [Lactobacillus sp.]|jgi:hypothetical protein|nr:hypothetical protein [Lactobacillus sp.]
MNKIILISVSLLCAAVFGVSAQSYEFDNTVVTICEEPAEGYPEFSQEDYNAEISAKIIQSLINKEYKGVGGDFAKVQNADPEAIRGALTDQFKKPDGRQILIFRYEKEDAGVSDVQDVYTFFDVNDSKEDKEVLFFMRKGVYTSIRYDGSFYIIMMYQDQNGNWVMLSTSDFRAATREPIILALKDGKTYEMSVDWGLVTIKYDGELCLKGKFHNFTANKPEIEIYKGSKAKYLHVRELKK